MRLILIALILGVAACSPSESLPPPEDTSFRVARIFQNGMVAQRASALPVWGIAPPGTDVTVKLDDEIHTVRTGASARWRIEMEPRSAGGPHTLTITAGEDALEISDLIYGDVWVASGQSNMEWVVANSRDAATEIAAANDPAIRQFKVPLTWAYQPQEELAGGAWSSATPEAVGDFSAVAYFFARELRRHVPVPIGIINTSWGGSRIEPWMDSKSLGMTEAEQDSLFRAGSRKNRVPTLLYNQMIHPIVDFPVTGFLWYQGESNAGVDDAPRYAGQFKAMIQRWRELWRAPEAPFLFVQLANYMAPSVVPTESSWAILRESQSAALALQGVAEAVIIDIGEAADIHPRNKQDVGLRLSLAARALAYGQQVVHSGPVYTGHELRGSEVLVRFSFAEGLRARGGPVGGFALAAEDGPFEWAEGRIDGNAVILSAPGIDQPFHVRYAWADNPDRANLYNGAGLPASPFRTGR